jgi:hypothetical protein
MPGKQNQALEVCRNSFQGPADLFQEDRRASLLKEQRRLEDWLKARAQSLCGEAMMEQVSLFDSPTINSNPARWKTEEDPNARLLALTQDAHVSRSKRVDAEIALQHFNRRLAEWEQRSKLKVHEPAPLGMLLLVP